MVAHGDSENLRDSTPPPPQVNPEVFQERQMIPAQVGDQNIATNQERNLEAELRYAQQTTTDVANQFLLRTTALTPAEFKVMGGVLDLGLKLGGWSPENIQQIQACLNERAGHQQDPSAAQGLRLMAEKIGGKVTSS